MSMHWKPPAKPVVLGKSRIRRDPVALVSDVPSARRAARRLTKREEMWFGVAGVLLFAAALAVAIVGLSWATWFKEDPAVTARSLQFGQCYNAIGPNCVTDGDTIYVSGSRVQIAGMEAPSIQDARCDAERDKGVSAAVELQNLLNSGPITMSATFRDEIGRDVRTVKVKGHNVASTLFDEGLVRYPGSKTRPWC